MGEIVNDLLVSLRAHLQDKMVDNVPEEYEAMLIYVDSGEESHMLRPSLIKIGRLQDDPTTLAEDTSEPSIHIGIHTNDPEDMSDGWKHSVASSVESSSTNLSLHVGYPYEIGGSRRWWRRIKLTFEAYFIDSDQTQEEATRLANLVRALLERYCESWRHDNPHGWRCGGRQDSLNETALESFVAKAHCWEGGGPEDDYIWRGGVWVQILTERE